MNTAANPRPSFAETKKFAREYIETVADIYKLRAIRFTAKTTGYVIWLIICLMLMLLLFIFLGLTAGLWLSSLTGSYIKGFAITSGAIVLVIVLLGMMKQVLFVNPVIRAVLQTLKETKDVTYDEHSNSTADEK